MIRPQRALFGIILCVLIVIFISMGTKAWLVAGSSNPKFTAGKGLFREYVDTPAGSAEQAVTGSSKSGGDAAFALLFFGVLALVYAEVCYFRSGFQERDLRQPLSFQRATYGLVFASIMCASAVIAYWAETRNLDEEVPGGWSYGYSFFFIVTLSFILFGCGLYSSAKKLAMEGIESLSDARGHAAPRVVPDI